MYTIRETYYDSPREDCSGFYYHDYEFKSFNAAVRAYYRWIENCDQPFGYETDFDIPLDIRMKHNDVSYVVKTLNGGFKKAFHRLEDASAYVKEENAFILSLIRINPKAKDRAELYQKFYCRAYIV